MANVKLKEDYDNHKAGEVISLPAVIARGLINNGKAMGGNLSWKPRKETATIDEERGSDFPQHTHAGWYELSNGEKVRGKEEAIEAENNL